MRAREANYKNESGILVYVTKEEKETTEIKEKINNYKKQYQNVCVFVSGDKDIRPVLKQMILTAINN